MVRNVGPIWDGASKDRQTAILISAGIPAWETPAFVGIPWRNLNDSVKRSIRSVYG